MFYSYSITAVCQRSHLNNYSVVFQFCIDYNISNNRTKLKLFSLFVKKKVFQSLASLFLFIFAGTFWLPSYSWVKTALYCGGWGRGWPRTGSRQAAVALQHGRKLKPYCPERHVRRRASPFWNAPPLPLSDPRPPRTEPLPSPTSQWGAVSPCGWHGPRQSSG